MSRVAAIIIAFAVVFTNTGCKESSILNTNLTPAGDSLHIEGEDEAIEVETVFRKWNTSQKLEGLYQGIGRIAFDPETGSTDASVFFQVVPPQSAGYVLPDSALIDSIVVVMPYVGFTYGDTANPVAQTFSVNLIQQPFGYNDVYYNTDNLASSAQSLGTVTLDHNQLYDSVSAEGKMQIPHLRIKLDRPEMIKKLKAAAYTDYAAFLNSFYGLKVSVNNNGQNNTIPYFRLAGSSAGTDYESSGMIIYYHDAGTPNEMKKTSFNFNSGNCAHFNKIIYNNAGSSAADPGNEFVYFNSLPGHGIKITTKNIKDAKLRIVNKAEIVITQEINSVDDKYAASPVIFAFRDTFVNSKDTLYDVEDFTFTSSSGTQVSGVSFMGGTKRVVSINGTNYNQWVINVPKELQRSLNAGQEMKLVIMGAPLGFLGAFRAKAYGTGTDPGNPSAPLKIRLNVVYSSL